MRDGEPNMYTALAMLRNGQTQLQWGRIQMLLGFNAIAIPLLADPARTEFVKFVLSVVGLAVHIALVSAATRGSWWIDYWNDKLAEFERLDSEESDPTGVRVKVFTDPDFRSIYKTGVILKWVFIGVGVIFGIGWLTASIYYLL